MKTNIRFVSYIDKFLEQEMFQTRFRENQNTHFVFSNFFFFFENRAVYEIMCKSIVEPDMRIACWIPKATNTHTEYVILIAVHCYNGCTNAPQHYVVRILPVLYLS